MLKNYRDVSHKGSTMNAGFQFEFYCESCSRTWTSPFEAYRRGQLAGFLDRFAHFISDRGTMFRASNAMADVGAAGAQQRALNNALELAQQRYTECPSCAKAVDEECWNSRARTCEHCATGQSHSAQSTRGHDHNREPEGRGMNDGGGRDRAEAGGGLKCPNCSTTVAGGRFCEECGFDMAATHKSCPGCGTMCSRATRFCADCGHAF